MSRIDSLYYGGSFFAKDTLFHPEQPIERFGMAGDPVPYSIAGDDLITSLLLGCFLLALIAYSKSQNFILRQIKDFFKIPNRDRKTVLTETANELWFQIFLVVQTCLMIAILWLYVIRETIGTTFSLEPYQMVGLFTLTIVLYFLLKTALYSIVNWVFFSRPQNEQWLKSFLFLISAEGALFFPVVMLVTYFDLSIHTTMVYVTIIIIVIKILLFYKQYIIFFRENIFVLQSFLYLCALEIVPLCSLYGVLRIMSGLLRINY